MAKRCIHGFLDAILNLSYYNTHGELILVSRQFNIFGKLILIFLGLNLSAKLNDRSLFYLFIWVLTSPSTLYRPYHDGYIVYGQRKPVHKVGQGFVL